MRLQVAFCGYAANAEDAAELYIANTLGVTRYYCMKEGEEYPLRTCPNCDNEALVYEEGYTETNGICFACGNTPSPGDYVTLRSMPEALRPRGSKRRYVPRLPARLPLCRPSLGISNPADRTTASRRFTLPETLAQIHRPYIVLLASTVDIHLGSDPCQRCEHGNQGCDPRPLFGSFCRVL
jgi:hypothetical protein